MAEKMKDLKGLTFGKLTVLELAGQDKDKRFTWKVKCECGQEKIVCGKNLLNGNTKGCGYCGKGTLKKCLIGQTFNDLTPFEEVEKKGGLIMYNCKCVCGRTKIVAGKSLKANNTKSCGFCKRSTLPKDLKNQKFGELITLESVGLDHENRVLWKCLCSCGNETTVSSHFLLAKDRDHRCEKCKELSYKEQDITGQRFGMLTVIEKCEKIFDRISWKVRCDCGKESKMTANNLRSGKANSCGCQNYQNRD